MSEFPAILATNLIVLLTHFVLTDSPLDRFWPVYLLFSFVCLAAQVHGNIIGSLLSHNVVAAVFTAPNTTVPLILLSGFLIRIKSMPYVFQLMSYGSYLRFGFQGLMVALFGFSR